MKKLLVVIFFSGIAFAAAAQTRNSEAELWQHATTISRQMTNKLELIEQEYIQIKTLTFENLRNINRITDYYAYNPRLQRQKLQEAENAYEWQLRNILNARQVAQYLARKEEAEPVLTSVPAQ